MSTSDDKYGCLLYFRKNGETRNPYFFTCDKITIGGGDEADIRLKFEHEHLMPVHCVIDVSSKGFATILNKSQGAPVKVNGDVVEKLRVLKHKDKLEVVGKFFQYENENICDKDVDIMQENLLRVVKTPAKKRRASALPTVAVKSPNKKFKRRSSASADFAVTPDNKRDSSYIVHKAHTTSKLFAPKIHSPNVRGVRLSLENKHASPRKSNQVSARNILLPSCSSVEDTTSPISNFNTEVLENVTPSRNIPPRTPNSQKLQMNKQSLPMNKSINLINFDDTPVKTPMKTPRNTKSYLADIAEEDKSATFEKSEIDNTFDVSSLKLSFQESYDADDQFEEFSEVDQSSPTKPADEVADISCDSDEQFETPKLETPRQSIGSASKNTSKEDAGDFETNDDKQEFSLIQTPTVNVRLSAKKNSTDKKNRQSKDLSTTFKNTSKLGLTPTAGDFKDDEANVHLTDEQQSCPIQTPIKNVRLSTSMISTDKKNRESNTTKSATIPTKLGLADDFDTYNEDNLTDEQAYSVQTPIKNVRLSINRISTDKKKRQSKSLLNTPRIASTPLKTPQTAPVVDILDKSEFDITNVDDACTNEIEQTFQKVASTDTVEECSTDGSVEKSSPSKSTDQVATDTTGSNFSEGSDIWDEDVSQNTTAPVKDSPIKTPNVFSAKKEVKKSGEKSVKTPRNSVRQSAVRFSTRRSKSSEVNDVITLNSSQESFTTPDNNTSVIILDTPAQPSTTKKSKKAGYIIEDNTTTTTPKSAIKPGRRSKSLPYQPAIEDVTPVTPERPPAEEKTFKTPGNTPGLFESIRKSAIKSRKTAEVPVGNKRARESSGTITRSCKKPKLDYVSTSDIRIDKSETSSSSFDSFITEDGDLYTTFDTSTDDPSLPSCFKNLTDKPLINVPRIHKSFTESKKKRTSNRRSLHAVRLQMESSGETIEPTISAEATKSSTKKVYKSPKNDLTDVAGVKRLLRTPRNIKSPKNDLSNVAGLKKLLQTPKTKSPKNDLSDVVGVKRLLRTPKVQKAPKNDLTEIVGVKKLMTTPKVQNVPKNDLSDVAGLKKLLKTPKEKKSPMNDLTNVVGVKKLLTTPKQYKSPKNDLSNVAGVKKLLRTPRVNSPKNDLSDLGGVSELFNISGVARLQDEDPNDIENTDYLFSKLTHRNPIKTYRTKSLSPVKEEATCQYRKTLGDEPYVSPQLEKWLQDQRKLVETNTTQKGKRATPKGKETSHKKQKIETKTPEIYDSRKNLSKSPNEPVVKSKTRGKVQKKVKNSEPETTRSTRGRRKNAISTQRPVALVKTSTRATRQRKASVEEEKVPEVNSEPVEVKKTTRATRKRKETTEEKKPEEDVIPTSKTTRTRKARVETETPNTDDVVLEVKRTTRTRKQKEVVEETKPKDDVLETENSAAVAKQPNRSTRKQKGHVEKQEKTVTPNKKKAAVEVKKTTRATRKRKEEATETPSKSDGDLEPTTKTRKTRKRVESIKEAIVPEELSRPTRGTRRQKNEVPEKPVDDLKLPSKTTRKTKLIDILSDEKNNLKLPNVDTPEKKKTRGRKRKVVEETNVTPVETKSTRRKQQQELKVVLDQSVEVNKMTPTPRSLRANRGRNNKYNDEEWSTPVKKVRFEGNSKESVIEVESQVRKSKRKK